MFGKVKKWLGIEGVKLELLLPEEIRESSGVVNGQIRFTSMNDQTVSYMKIIMVEKFSRGRGEEKLIDEYELGSIDMDTIIEIPANEAVEIEFELPFEMMKSEMDEMEDKNIFMGGLVKAAKWVRGAKSEFRIIAEAKVKGVALDPFDKRTIDLV